MGVCCLLSRGRLGRKPGQKSLASVMQCDPPPPLGQLQSLSPGPLSVEQAGFSVPDRPPALPGHAPFSLGSCTLRVTVHQRPLGGTPQTRCSGEKRCKPRTLSSALNLKMHGPQLTVS